MIRTTWNSLALAAAAAALGLGLGVARAEAPPMAPAPPPPPAAREAAAAPAASQNAPDAAPNAKAADGAAEKTPSLSLQDLKGSKRSLGELRGQVVLLNFWASWCGPCRKEMPELEVLRQQAGAGLSVIGASTDDPGDIEQVRGFVAKHKLGFPIWLNATTEDMERFGLPAVLPSSVLIDRDGRIVDRFAGMVAMEKLRARIAPLLAASAPPPGKPAPAARTAPK